MSGNTRIKKIGQCRYDSPLDSAVFIDDSEGILIDATLSSLQGKKGRPPFFERLVHERKSFSTLRKLELHSLPAVDSARGSMMSSGQLPWSYGIGMGLRRSWACGTVLRASYRHLTTNPSSSLRTWLKTSKRMEALSSAPPEGPRTQPLWWISL